MSENHFKTFIKGSAVSVVGAGLLGVLNYFIRRYLAVNLSEIEYGFFYSAFAMVMLAMSFIDMGLGQSSQILISQSQHSPDRNQGSRFFSCFFYISLIVSGIVFLVFESAIPMLADLFFKYPEGKVALAVIFLIIIVQPIEGVIINGLTAKKFFISRNVLAIAKSLFILIILFCVKPKLCSASAAYSAGGILVIICGWFMILKWTALRLMPLRKLVRSDISKLFSISVWVAVSTAGLSSIYYLDTLCLTLLKGLDAVAIYNIALPLMQIVQSLIIFPAVFTPIAAEMWVKGDRHGILKIWEKVIFLLFLMLPFLIVGGYFGGEYIITILFSAKYVSAAPVMTVLWVGMVFYSVAGFNMVILNSAGQQKSVALIICVGCIISIALNCVFIPFFGVIGAAVTNLITYIFLALTTSLVFIKIIKGKADARKIE